MKAKMWGIRGSMYIYKPENAVYGCNTTCIEVTTDNNDIIIFDAGTGINNLSEDILARNVERKELHLLLTHPHWDHIQGLVGFSLLLRKDWAINIYAVKNYGGIGLKGVLQKLFDTSQHPVPPELFSKMIYLHEFEPDSSFMINNTKVQTVSCNHPGGSMGYRLDENGRSLFFSGDHEHTDEFTDKLSEVMHGLDIAIVDASYTLKDYQTRKGWGHTPIETWLELTHDLQIKQLIFTHHTLEYHDARIEELTKRYRKNEPPETRVSFAFEGMEITEVPKRYYPESTSVSDWISDFTRKVSKYYNVATILDTILTEARQICRADAGTIYLVEGEDILSFEYTQNDTLFKGGDNKHLYVSAKIPINNISIAGYVANNSESLNIVDVYDLENDVPYSFNRAFDESTGYRTCSMLTLPLIGTNARVIGVLQLINSLEDGEPVTFSEKMIERVKLLCIIASNAIQKGQMSVELIMRMLAMSKLKDPKETGAHVIRVGTVAAELYMYWAKKNHIDIDKAKFYQDNIRLAAMLHDVGKIGIPDAIIKKPGKLTDDERKYMEQHCSIGSDLFKGSNLFIDSMSHEIALHHHQKWNGTGYTGCDGAGVLSGADIPLSARITSIADVYDALVSKRSYKEAWEDSKALEILKEEAGVAFDPELVECFLEIQETVQAIYNKFKDEDDE